MLNKLMEKLKIRGSDDALISKLERIKGSTEKRRAYVEDTDLDPGQSDELEELEIGEGGEEGREGEKGEYRKAGGSLQSKLEALEEKIIGRVEEELGERLKTLEEIQNSLRELDERVTRMDLGVSSAKQTVDTFKDRLDKMDENVLELLSLYEVVSNTVNPFVGDGEGGGMNIERMDYIENQVKDLSNTLNTLQSELSGIQTTIEAHERALQEGMGERVASEMEKFHEEMRDMMREQIERVKEEIKREVAGEAALKEECEDGEYGECEDSSAERDEPVGEKRSKKSSYRLTRIDNRPESAIILLNWIEFLMEKVGRNNLMEILDYYVEIKWISEKVSIQMMSYADGIDYYVEKPTWKLLPEDHIKSLMFIEQLRGKKIDKNVFTKLEREIDRVKNSMETLYGV
ncbi:Archaeal flagella protein [Candidatus Methanoperedenaceae archaeon GB37]|nr:Archaeal flagella protein [Candidatus Methanoperedenaceae archaeon GB37]